MKEPGRATLLRPVRSLSSAEEAGGKAWSLARMVEQGIDVPPAMVLTCESFDLFVRANGLDALEVEHGPDIVDRAGFARRASEIRERILSSPIPLEIEQALAEWWPQVSGSWVVRSSAVGEDSETASFAGQLDSVLRVKTFEGLQTAVLTCWASYWSERALAYRLARGVQLRSMGVIVQAMIEPVQGGVLFTRSPENSEFLRIEYVDGHPESLVSGAHTPRSIELPRAAPVHERYGVLAHQGMALEKAFGRPQDVEWLIDRSGKLWFVQCRPITVLSEKGPLVVWSNVNINENYPEPVSPLLYSIARESYENYFLNIGRAFGLPERTLEQLLSSLRHSVGIHGARLYYNLTNIHRCIQAAPLGSHLCAAFDSFVGVEDEGSAGAVPRDAPEPTGASPWDLIRVGVSAARSMSTLSRRVERFEARTWAYALDTTNPMLAEATLLHLLEQFRRFIDIRFRRWTDASLADVAAALSVATLKALLRYRLDDQAARDLTPTLLLAIPGVVSAGAVNSLWDLSRTARNDAGLSEKIRSAESAEDCEALYAELRDGAFPDFYQQFGRHIERWGFRVSGELMLHIPSYQEQPARLLPLVAGFLDIDGPSPRESTTRQARRRDAAVAELGKQLGWPWAPMLRRVLRMTQRSICYRERVRLKQALIYRRFRCVLLEMGKRLVQQGRLTRPDDLLYLEWQEVEAWLSGNLMLPDSVPELVSLRRREHQIQSARSVPDIVRLRPGEYLDSGTQTTRVCGEAHELEGVGVSGGKIRARARVMSGLADASRFRKGEILVARQTDPGWATLFFLASGLVMERGGMLSHGAIVAREFGIPAVIAVPDATDRIKTGEMLLVDGDQGRVIRQGSIA